MEQEWMKIGVHLKDQLQHYRSWIHTLDTIQNNWDKEIERQQQQPNLTQHSVDFKYLECKTREYENTSAYLLNCLHKTMQTCSLNDVSISDFEYATLVQRYKDLQQWEAKVKPLTQTLASYRSLPPDITMSKQSIENVKRELYQLEEQLRQSVAQLQLIE
jgi:hypothetical protein